MGEKPRLRACNAEWIKPGMRVLAPATMKIFLVHGVTEMFDGTLHISLDECNNRHLRRKPGKTVWVAA